MHCDSYWLFQCKFGDTDRFVFFFEKHTQKVIEQCLFKPKSHPNLLEKKNEEAQPPNLFMLKPFV